MMMLEQLLNLKTNEKIKTKKNTKLRLKTARQICITQFKEWKKDYLNISWKLTS